MDSSREETVEFLKKVFRPEKKKMILPAFMTLILLVGIASGMHLRSQGVGEIYSENIRSGVLNSMVIDAEHRYFNDSINKSRKERISGMEGRSDWSEGVFMKAEAGLVGLIVGTNVFPMSPETAMFSGTSSSVYKLKDRYLIEEYPKAVVEQVYYGYRLRKLEERIENNPGEWDLKRFRRKVEDIRSVRYPDREIISYLEEVKDRSKENVQARGGVFEESTLKNLVNQDVKEVRFYHFLPTVLATFLIYYLVSCILFGLYRLDVLESERLLSRESLDHSIVSMATFYSASLVAVGYLFVKFVMGVYLQWEGLGVLLFLEFMIGIAYFYFAGLITSDYKWLKRAVAVSVFGVLFSVLYVVISEPDVLLGLLIWVAVQITLVGVVSYLMERNIAEDFRSGEI
ncbi:MAG: hypothetical protein ABEJ93_05300 [Candidatus Nanohalobium sp.]